MPTLPCFSGPHFSQLDSYHPYFVLSVVGLGFYGASGHPEPAGLASTASVAMMADRYALPATAHVLACAPGDDSLHAETQA